VVNVPDADGVGVGVGVVGDGVATVLHTFTFFFLPCTFLVTVWRVFFNLTLCAPEDAEAFLLETGTATAIRVTMRSTKPLRYFMSFSFHTRCRSTYKKVWARHMSTDPDREQIDCQPIG
jgi:hypothetical protein